MNFKNCKVSFNVLHPLKMALYDRNTLGFHQHEEVKWICLNDNVHLILMTSDFDCVSPVVLFIPKIKLHCSCFP
jgi:hypothetical protein